MNERKCVVITDLDNTLFDWFEAWYQSFNAMLLCLVEKSELPRETLVQEIKTIHQIHGTSEYAFVIESIPSIQARFPNEDLVQRFDECIHAHSKMRKKHLHLYPGVRDTLRWLKGRNCQIVAYTESMAFYTNRRVRELELDGLLDVLYSPADHDLPENLKPDEVRRYPKETYQLKDTKHRYTPKGELKPHPKLLLDIVTGVGAKPEECVYVGDSLMKDVAMAQHAGIADVHAKYGVAHKQEEYELLRAVTHWTEEMVERERMIDREEITPTHILENSFSELSTMFEFGSAGS